MEHSIYAVCGDGGYGREVMPLARQQLIAMGVPLDRLVFVGMKDSLELLNGHRVITHESFLKIPAKKRYMTIALASSGLRERLHKQCIQDSVEPWDIQASNVVRMDNVTIGHGSILSPFVTITSNVRVGIQFHANIYSYVAHDCVIGDYVTFAPSVQCNGHVEIDDHAYIGTNATLRQGTEGKPLRIGKGAVIGMGAVVTKDVSAGATVVGNPARLFSK
jgi:sugar O-acyltransferase (sialic acid O-acetyltransferase NeuD family)